MSAAIKYTTLSELAQQANRSTSALKEWYRTGKNTEGYEDLRDMPLSADFVTDRQTELFTNHYPPLSSGTDRDRQRQTGTRIIPMTDRQVETATDRQTELDNLRQTVADRDRQIETDRQKYKTELDRQTDKYNSLDSIRQDLNQQLTELKDAFNQLQSSKGTSDVDLLTKLASKDADIKILTDKADRLEQTARQLQTELDRQKILFKTELKAKFDEYEAAFQTERQTELERLASEHAAKIEAEKEKLFFETIAFAKYGLLIFTLIQAYVAGLFLEQYLQVPFLIALGMGIPIAYGGLLSTMYLTTTEDKSRYLIAYTTIFAVMEAAYFFPKCDWNGAKIFGTTVYIILMFVMGNSWARIYFKIK
jgi:hypothetical protein